MKLKPQDCGAGRGFGHHPILVSQITDEKMRHREVKWLVLRSHRQVRISSTHTYGHFLREGKCVRVKLAIIFDERLLQRVKPVGNVRWEPGGLKLCLSFAPQSPCMKNGCIIHLHFTIVERLCEWVTLRSQGSFGLWGGWEDSLLLGWGVGRERCGCLPGLTNLSSDTWSPPRP